MTAPSRTKGRRRADTAAAWRPWQEALGVAAILLVVAVVVYWPALSGGFVWDDDTILTDNRLVHAADGLYRIWFTTDALDYWPITNSSFWLEWRLWGLDATGYHVTNLLLHVANAFLFWRILRRLTVPGAFLGSLIFLVHPLNVESVAWITQRKNTLSMLFLLTSVLCYLHVQMKDDGERSAAASGPAERRWYWLSLLAFTLAMLSKASVVVLPVLLLLLVWWRRPIRVADFIDLAPFFGIGGALTIVNLWFRTHGTDVTIRHTDVLSRLLGAAGAVWFYAYKTFIPTQLTFIYPQWQVDAGDVRWWAPLLLLVAAAAVLFSQHRRPVGRTLLFSGAFFVVSLLPVLGFVDVYFMKYSLVADHYAYIAITALIAPVAALLWRFRTWFGGPRFGGAAACLIVTMPLGIQTWRHAAEFADAETLYRSTIQKNPRCWLAYDNLGILQVTRKNADVRDIVPLFQAAIAVNPDDAVGHDNLALAWERLGRLEEAAGEHRQAIRADPTLAAPHANLSSLFVRLGRKEEALTEATEAIRLDPHLAEAHNSLATSLAQLGRTDEAIAEFREAVRLKPGSPQMHANLGNALRSAGRASEAVTEHQLAIQLDPNDADIRRDYGEDLAAADRPADARGQFYEALRLQPNSAATHRRLANLLDATGQLNEALPHYEAAANLGSKDPAMLDEFGDALRRSGRPDEAARLFQRSLELEPDYGPAHFHVGFLLQSAGKLEAAVVEYEAALRYGSSAEVHNNLGVLLMRLGRREQAIGHFREALRLQPDDTFARDNLAKALAGRF